MIDGSAPLVGAVIRLTAAISTPPTVERGGVAQLDTLLGQVLPALGGVDWASITRRRGEASHRTTAASAALARDLDALQYRGRQGPCLEAIASSETVRVDDLGAEPRWPEFTRGALELGARSVLSLPLRRLGYEGASINLYGSQAGPIGPVDPDDVESLLAMTALAAAAVEQRGRAETLQIALASNRSIAAAIGIVMARYECGYAAAFGLLRRVSQESNRKLRDLADEVVRTGHPPVVDPVE